jgi:hypothetical protein
VKGSLNIYAHCPAVAVPFELNKSVEWNKNVDANPSAIWFRISDASVSIAD